MVVSELTPHGFCAGVIGAIKKAAELKKAYCLHELVHNELVVNKLKAQGFQFVEDLNEVPVGSTVLFSAHGVSPKVRELAADRKLKVVDATCPFVQRVHNDAKRFSDEGRFVVVIGKADHAEVKGILGEIARGGVYPCECPKDIAVVSQTTMNSDKVAAIIEELKKTHNVTTQASVCNATKLRQDAVRNFKGDALLVLGSASSSNTRELCEVFQGKTFRAATLDEVKALDFSGINNLGVTSGASTPEDFYEATISYLRTTFC